MTNVSLDMLREAIARNCGVVLSLPSAGMLRHHKSRFLAEGAPGEGFFLESVPGEQPLIDELIASGQPAGVSFKGGVNKVVFAVPIRRREPAFHVNAQTTVEALLLEFPAEVKAAQRRASYRVTVPADSDLRARVWRVSPEASLKERPMPAQEIACELRDISVGGLGVTIRPREGQPVMVATDDRLRIELVLRDVSLLLEGQLRYPPNPAPNEPVRGGIQFKALQDDLEGRQASAKLARIVGEMQREEVRRRKLGLT